MPLKTALWHAGPDVALQHCATHVLGSGFSVWHLPMTHLNHVPVSADMPGYHAPCSGTSASSWCASRCWWRGCCGRQTTPSSSCPPPAPSPPWPGWPPSASPHSATAGARIGVLLLSWLIVLLNSNHLGPLAAVPAHALDSSAQRPANQPAGISYALPRSSARTCRSADRDDCVIAEPSGALCPAQRALVF